MARTPKPKVVKSSRNPDPAELAGLRQNLLNQQITIGGLTARNEVLEHCVENCRQILKSLIDGGVFRVFDLSNYDPATASDDQLTDLIQYTRSACLNLSRVTDPIPNYYIGQSTDLIGFIYDKAVKSMIRSRLKTDQSNKFSVLSAAYALGIDYLSEDIKSEPDIDKLLFFGVDKSKTAGSST